MAQPQVDVVRAREKAATPALPLTGTPTVPLSLRVVTTEDGLAALRVAWSALSDVAIDRSLYLSHDFVTCWWEAFGAGAPGLSLAILVLQEQERTVAIAPLVRTKERWMGLPARVLRIAGNAYSMRLGVLAFPGREAAVAERIGRWLAEQPEDAASFDELLADSPMTRALLDALPHAGFAVATRPGARDSFVRLAGEFEEYRRSRSRKTRQTMERKARNLARAHSVEYVLETAPGDVGRLLAEIETVARQSWSHREGTSVASDPATALFFRRLATRAAQSGDLFAGLLRIDGRPTAFALNVRHRGVIYGLKTAYDETFAELSPGRLLQWFLIQRAFADEEAEELDFAGHLQPYKAELATGARDQIHVRAYRRLRPAYLEHLVQDGLAAPLRGSRVLRAGRAALGRWFRGSRRAAGIGVDPSPRL